MMIRVVRLLAIHVAVLASAAMAGAQPAKTNAPARLALASVMDAQLRTLESQFVPAAEAMPAEKYGFAPDRGEYRGVRTFALQVKHVATANVVFYSALLGQPLPPGVTLAGATNGPDEIHTKDQILKYLRESFALGHQAFAALSLRTALTPLARPPVPTMSTPLALASWSCAHAWDHYGQIAEYLRMNGIVPPASVGQPAANPTAK